MNQSYRSAGLNQLLSDCAEAIDSSFSFAFQPVIELNSMRVKGHEALVRGLSQESADSVIAAIRPENQYLFDQACRMRALDLAKRLNITGQIHLNCSHVWPENLSATMANTQTWAHRCGIEPQRIVLELNDLKPFSNPKRLNEVSVRIHEAGFKLLADQFGSSEAGLKRIAILRPDFLKLDRMLVCDIDSSIRRQAIVHGTVAMSEALGIEVIANGVERIEEADWLQNAGIELCQGFLFARPAFEALPALERGKVA